MSAQTAISSVLCHSVESFSRAYVPTKLESLFVWYWLSGLAGTLKVGSINAALNSSISALEQGLNIAIATIAKQ